MISLGGGGTRCTFKLPQSDMPLGTGGSATVKAPSKINLRSSTPFGIPALCPNVSPKLDALAKKLFGDVLIVLMMDPVLSRMFMPTETYGNFPRSTDDSQES
jgi:hypothetical protein